MNRLIRLSRPLVVVGLVFAVLISGMHAVSADVRNTDRMARLGEDGHAAVGLACAAQRDDGGPFVACRWHLDEPDVDVRAWQLWRLKVAPEVGQRTLVTEVGADTTAARDTAIDSPAKYVYAVVGLGVDGEPVARSRVATVRIGDSPSRDLEILHLECAGSVADEVPVIGCDWSPVEHAAAVEYRVYRATGDHHRVLVATIGLDATSYRDTRVEPGVRYRYTVAAFDGRGRMVAIARPESVGVPLPERDRHRDEARDAVRTAGSPNPDGSIETGPADLAESVDAAAFEVDLHHLDVDGGRDRVRGH